MVKNKFTVTVSRSSRKNMNIMGLFVLHINSGGGGGSLVYVIREDMIDRPPVGGVLISTICKKYSLGGAGRVLLCKNVILCEM